MFDNPKKELQRLQDRLLAAEEEEWQPETDDPEAALAAVKQILARDGWEEKGREPLSRSFVPRKVDVLPDEPEEEEELPPASKRKRRIGGLFIALMLELIALGAVIIWWMLWK